MSDQFKIGDTVKLKSGSPKMTIQRLKSVGKPKGIFRCQWFDGIELKFGDFHKDTLQIVNEDPLENSNS